MAGDGPNSDRRSRDAEISVGWRMAGLGMEVAAQAAGGALLGWLYDRWRGTGPTGTIIGAMLGIVVGLWTLIRGGLKLNRQLDELASKRRAERQRQQQSGSSVMSPGPGSADTYAEAEDQWEQWNDDDWGDGDDSDDDSRQ